ncbi:hypothetical protein Tco_0201092 [Tanacetum coccineum]
MKACKRGDRIYGLDEHEALKQWHCHLDNERRCMKGRNMSFPDFFLVRYGGSELDDSIRARRYNEWCTENNSHRDYKSTSTPNIESDTLAPQRIIHPSNQEDPILSTKSYFPNSSPINQNKLQPWNYSFEEWLKVKIRHTNVDKSIKSAVLNEWILDSFDVEADFAGICNDPYSWSLDEYKAVFDINIEQLANEYKLRIRKKGYVSDIQEKDKNNGKIEKAEHGNEKSAETQSRRPAYLSRTNPDPFYWAGTQSRVVMDQKPRLEIGERPGRLEAQVQKRKQRSNQETERRESFSLAYKAESPDSDPFPPFLILEAQTQNDGLLLTNSDYDIEVLFPFEFSQTILQFHRITSQLHQEAVLLTSSENSNDNMIPPILLLHQLLLTHILVLLTSLLFDSRYFFVPEELLPPKKRICSSSSSSTTLSNSSWNQTCDLVSPSSSVYTPTSPQIFEKCPIKMNGDKLKGRIKKIRTQIIKLQKKRLGQKDKIAFAYYRISDLEQIIEKIQARH